MLNWKRKLAYKWLAAPFHTILDIAKNLDLLEKEKYAGLNSDEIRKMIFVKAKEGGKLESLKTLLQ